MATQRSTSSFTSNTTALQGACEAPFLQESKFPLTGGYIPGRYCSPLPDFEDIKCCLPCPATDWIYPDNFYPRTRVSEWLSVGGLVLCCFVMLSFAFLPIEKTKRQYLNVCLILSIMLVELGFIIPLGVRPEQCYNEITPNDMYSSLTCAWSGALIIAGGVSINVWILIRTLSMHLQICWNITPGHLFFWAAQVLGWGVSGVIVTLCLVLTGVSFRFGEACHVNHHNSLQTIWGEMLGVAGLSSLLQLLTFGYCMKVYLRNLWSDDRQDSESSRGQTSSLGSTRNQTTRALYRRIRKVFRLQWRGLLICIIVVADVVFFTVVFLYLDNKTQSAVTNFKKLFPWIICIAEGVADGTGKEKCLGIAADLVTGEGLIIATLVLLSVVGVQAFLLIGRWDMIIGWWDMAKALRHRGEFTSLDTEPFSGDKCNYELLKVASPVSPIGNPEKSILRSPPTTFSSPQSRNDTSDFFTKEVSFDQKVSRPYQQPRMSFSSPRRNTQQQPQWDPASTFAEAVSAVQSPASMRKESGGREKGFF